MKNKLEEARKKMDAALHILKLDVLKNIKEAVTDMYEAVECYEQTSESEQLNRLYSFEHISTIGVAGQWVAAFVSGIGIGIELILRADIGYITITAGALIFAFATKLKYYKVMRRK